MMISALQSSSSCRTKSLVAWRPRSIASIGQRPPFSWSSSWCRSLKVLWCLLFFSFEVARHPPRRWECVSFCPHFSNMNNKRQYVVSSDFIGGEQLLALGDNK